MQIIIDTREKKTHKKFLLKKAFSEMGLLFIDKKIDAGDYSFIHNGIDYSNKIVIERKSGDKLKGGGWDELKSNIYEFKKADGKDQRTGIGIRITDEFNRLCENRTEVILLIENAKGSEDIFNCSVHAKQRRAYHSNQEFFHMFFRWFDTVNRKRQNFGLNPVYIVYCQQENTAYYIKEIFTRYLNKQN